MCKNCVRIMLPKSESQVWVDAEDEWTHTDSVYGIDTKCICGQCITCKFLLENIKTNESVWVGSRCVDSTFELNDKLIISVSSYYCKLCDKTINLNSLNQHNKSKGHLKYKFCDTCKTTKILSTSKHSTCYGCFSGYSLCPDCKQYRIRGYYKRCYTCNEKHKK